MKKILLPFLISIHCACFSQNSFIVKTGIEANNVIYGGQLYDVTETNDGNYLATGVTYYGYKGDLGNTYLVKVNTTGQQLWSKAIDDRNNNGVGFGGRDEGGFGILNTNDGGFIISGGVNNHMALTKYDINGNIVWGRQYNQFVLSVAARAMQTADGGYLLPGGVSSDGTGDYQSCLIKTDSLGNVQWSKRYFSTPVSFIDDIKPTRDSNYIFVTDNFNFSSGYDTTYLVKVNNLGNVIWTKYFYEPFYLEHLSMLPASDGGFLITGGGYYSFLLKVNADGDYDWSETNLANDFQDTHLFSSIETPDGGYVSVGDGRTNFSSFSYVTKVNKSGVLLWTKTMDDAGSLYSVIKTGDGGYLAAGSIYEEGISDGLFIKFDADFNTCTPAGTYGGLSNSGKLTISAAPIFTGDVTTYNDTQTITNIGTTTNICRILPVTLLNFNALLQKKFVQIKWTTSEEINTSYFDIEKSKDAKVFNSIARVSAAGNSNFPKSYNKPDNNPYNGDNWYRLKIVDKDGAFTYSDVVRIIYSNDNNSMLYPNPAQNNTTVVFNAAKAGRYSIQVTELSGKVLQTIKGLTIVGKNKANLNVSGLNQGMYLITISIDEGDRIVLKFNKQ